MKIPSKIALGNLKSKDALQIIKSEQRPNYEMPEDILNFKFYFNKYTPEDGTINGPEMRKQVIYISVYHFLEYLCENPDNYDTEQIGAYFYSRITKDTVTCYYKDYHYKIEKYNYNVLKENFDIFIRYKK